MNEHHLIKFDIQTVSGIELIEITQQVQKSVEQSGILNGLAIIYTPHTTAAVTINENADPAVKSDMTEFYRKLVPNEPYFNHMEGNSPAHIMSSLISPTLTLIIERRRLILGTWQGIFFCEFDGPRARKVFVKMIGDK
jgi:secondary thiamine-phosphate synthase enzyme